LQDWQCRQPHILSWVCQRPQEPKLLHSHMHSNFLHLPEEPTKYLEIAFRHVNVYLTNSKPVFHTDNNAEVTFKEFSYWAYNCMPSLERKMTQVLTTRYSIFFSNWGYLTD
jgi:hypothetical protein